MRDVIARVKMLHHESGVHSMGDTHLEGLYIPQILMRSPYPKHNFVARCMCCRGLDRPHVEPALDQRCFCNCAAGVGKRHCAFLPVLHFILLGIFGLFSEWVLVLLPGS